MNFKRLGSSLYLVQPADVTIYLQLISVLTNRSDNLQTIDDLNNIKQRVFLNLGTHRQVNKFFR